MSSKFPKKKLYQVIAIVSAFIFIFSLVSFVFSISQFYLSVIAFLNNSSTFYKALSFTISASTVFVEPSEKSLKKDKKASIDKVLLAVEEPTSPPLNVENEFTEYFDKLFSGPLVVKACERTMLEIKKRALELRGQNESVLMKKEMILKTLKLGTLTSILPFLGKLPRTREFIKKYFNFDTFMANSRSLDFLMEFYQVYFEMAKYQSLAREYDERNYLGYVIGRILLKKPEMIGDSMVDGACSDLSDFATPFDREKFKRVIEGLLAKAQLSDEQVDFDPTVRSKLVSEKFYTGGVFDYLNGKY